jgi:hypothetical protein
MGIATTFFLQTPARTAHQPQQRLCWQSVAKHAVRPTRRINRCSIVEVQHPLQPHPRTSKTSICTQCLAIVRLGIPRLGTWRKQNQCFYEKVFWPLMALRIGIQGSSALQKMTGTASPSCCNAELLWRPILRAIGGQITFFIQSLFLLPPCTQSPVVRSLEYQNASKSENSRQ